MGTWIDIITNKITQEQVSSQSKVIEIRVEAFVISIIEEPAFIEPQMTVNDVITDIETHCQVGQGIDVIDEGRNLEWSLSTIRVSDVVTWKLNNLVTHSHASGFKM